MFDKIRRSLNRGSGRPYQMMQIETSLHCNLECVMCPWIDIHNDGKLLTQQNESEDAESPLTNREIEVLKLVAQGLDNPEIADKLVISLPTVRSHVTHILNKLGLSNRTQAVLYALRHNLVSLDE